MSLEDLGQQEEFYGPYNGSRQVLFFGPTLQEPWLIVVGDIITDKDLVNTDSDGNKMKVLELKGHVNVF